MPVFKWTGARFDGRSDVADWLRRFNATQDAFGNEEEGPRYKALVMALHEDVLTRIMGELQQMGEQCHHKEHIHHLQINLHLRLGEDSSRTFGRESSMSSDYRTEEYYKCYQSQISESIILYS